MVSSTRTIPCNESENDEIFTSRALASDVKTPVAVRPPSSKLAASAKSFKDVALNTVSNPDSSAFALAFFSFASKAFLLPGFGGLAAFGGIEGIKVEKELID